MDAPTEITFFEFLTPLITAGKKTITIRDEAESHYVPGTVVDVYTLESKSHVGKLKLKPLSPSILTILVNFTLSKSIFLYLS
ncbi:RNA-binding domain protein [Vibrio astriarenae]|nr:RNA-binding domain protein [Vibrio sp. C7]